VFVKGREESNATRPSFLKTGKRYRDLLEEKKGPSYQRKGKKKKKVF